MADLTQTTKTEPTIDELLEKHLSELPRELQQAILLFDWGNTMKGLADKYGLTIDKLGKLHYETLSAATGITDIADYYKNIKERLGLPDEKVGPIVGEVNEKVFSVIRARMKALMGSKKTEEEEIAALAKEGEEEGKTMTERMLSLPPEVQDVLAAPDLVDKIGTLATDHEVDPQRLDSLISLVLLAYIDPDQFETEVVSQLGLAEDKAAALAKAVEEAIWGNVKGALKLFVQKEQAAAKVEEVLGKIETEKAGGVVEKKVEAAAAEAARKTLLEEKLKGQFQLKATQAVAAPVTSTPLPSPAKPITPPAAPPSQIDPYRERPV